MTESVTNLELQERLSLIESMMLEGRRTTGRYAWTFVLWGVAYEAAIIGATWLHFAYAWPVMMVFAAIITVWFYAKQGNKSPETTAGRAIGSMWMALGTSLFLVLFAFGLSGHMNSLQIFVAIVSAHLGLVNGASGMLLRWRAQLGCAVVWWISSVVACFITAEQSNYLLMFDVLLCQILFGIYAMAREQKAQKRIEHHA